MARLVRSAALAFVLSGCTLQKAGTGESSTFDLDTGTVLEDTAVGVDTAVVDTREEVAVDSSVADIASDSEASTDTHVDVDTGDDAGDILVTTTELAVPANVDLTAEGTVSWAQFGFGDVVTPNRKSGPDIFSLLTPSATGVGRQGGYQLTFSWSDGAPTASASSANTGVYLNGVGSTASFTVEGDGGSRMLRVYLRAYAGAAGDASFTVGATTMTVAFAAGATRYVVCTVAFATSGQLGVKLTNTNGVPNLTLLAATLQ